MKEQNPNGRHITRRDFLGYTAAVTAATMVPRAVFAQPGIKPNSNFGGVQIGVITYSWRSMPSSADDLLNYLVQCGLSSVELMYGPAEEFAGAPTLSFQRPPRGTQMTDEQRAELQAAQDEQAKNLRDWRLSVPMSKYEALRKKYNDAGVDIYIIKFDRIAQMTPEEVDYCFNVARTLGAKGITVELSNEAAKFLGPFADKHGIMIGFHNHMEVNPQSWEIPFTYGRMLGMNFDFGHYTAGTNMDPIPIIERYADAGRILSLHVKDRKVNRGANMPLGQGDTPLALILQLMKRKQYQFPAHIELEYRIPEGSDAVAEVKNCVDYCRNVLTDPTA